MIPDVSMMGAISPKPGPQGGVNTSEQETRRLDREDETRRLQRVIEFERWMRRALDKKDENNGVVAYGLRLAQLPLDHAMQDESGPDRAIAQTAGHFYAQTRSQPTRDWLAELPKRWEPPATEPAAPASNPVPVQLPYLPELVDEAGRAQTDTLRIPALLFPEIASGHITQAVEKKIPVTRLDFQLTPPEFGQVHLQVSFQAGQVHVQVQTTSTQAATNLEQFVPRIREILGEYHLTPGSVQVVTHVANRPGAGGASSKSERDANGFSGTARRRRSRDDDARTITT